jgi:Smr domain
MAALFGIGTKVKFRTTTDSGVIVDKLGDGMVMVKLDGFNMDIPAFEEDLLRAEDFMASNIIVPPLSPKQIERKKIIALNTPLPTISRSAISIKPLFTGSGVHIAFEPLKKAGGEVEKFDILLLNDTKSDIVFALDFVLFDTVEWSKNGILKAVNFEKIGEIAFDVINDAPQFDVSLKPIYTEGVGSELLKTLKIKPKQFVKNFQIHNFISREVHAFTVFEKLEDNKTATNEDLTSYTKDLIKKHKNEKIKNTPPTLRYDPVPNVNEYASFVAEIDLHIEMLHESPRDLTTEEIVKIQISNFDAFLAKAIRLNVPKFHVIHGLGKGRLRDMIAARLRRHPDVLMFKNEYHERYGFGATEVWLR